MEGKKISFGFKKRKNAEKPITSNEEEKREYIECVEEKSIKVVGGDAVKNEDPLIIPMKPNTLITVERLREIGEQVEGDIDDFNIKNEPAVIEEVPENETLDQMAVRELMQEAQKEVTVEEGSLAIPTPAKPVIEGEKESTLDDYEAVPVQQFGLAMLRGMGWTPNKDGMESRSRAVPKQFEAILEYMERPKYKLPELRPKGLGLGAEKVTKRKQKQAAKDGKEEEELAIVKNSFVKINTGKYSGYYGKVVSLDEDNGRVMVDITVKKETVSLSEFMMQAVTKSEYDKESKVLNQDTYHQYKNNEKLSQKHDDKSSSKIKNPDRNAPSERDKNSERHKTEREEKSSNGRSREKSRHRSNSSSSEERLRKKSDKKKYSSSESLSSLSADDRRRRKHKSKSSKRHSNSSERESHKKSSSRKKDIDKKRKGKKKKRDRDRSPTYKKHKK